MLFASLAILSFGQLSVASPYCGIKAVYAAGHSISALDGVPFEDFIDVHYVSSLRGSSRADLLRLMSDHGLHGEPFDHRGIATLMSVKSPVILHVASAGQFENLNHWLLYLGQDGSQAQVQDGDGTVFGMDFQELLLRWKGSGIVVHRTTQARLGLSGALAELWFWFCLVGGCWMANSVYRWVESSFCVGRSSVGRFIVALTAAAIVVMTPALIWYLPGSAETINRLTAQMQLSHLGATLPEVSRETLITNLDSTLMIDARYPDDFLRRSVPGSLNAPVAMTRNELDALLSEIELDQSIVVYCLSSECRFSDHIASRLAGMGFRRVSIYRGGTSELFSEFPSN